MPRATRAKRVDPSDPNFVPRESRSEYESGVGRRSSVKSPEYKTLKSMGIAVDGRTLDTASLPLRVDEHGETWLDADRVQAELLRDGQYLSTIAVRYLLATPLLATPLLATPP